MKVNTKILSIPPYISTSWKNVLSVHIEARAAGPVLAVGLVSGSIIEVPHMDQAAMERVFSAHEQYLEQEAVQDAPAQGPPSAEELFENGGAAILNLPFNLGLDGNMSSLLQHNQEASNGPDLPTDVIDKITQLSSVIGLDHLEHFPKPEPHCNCTYCQIMRAMYKGKSDAEECCTPISQEEEVSDEDLKFREWDVTETEQAHIYCVSNPFNADEQFKVSLSSPIGCTCGKPNCEHICAVLHS